MTPTRAARVREVTTLGPTLKRFVLEPEDGGKFPPAEAGAHVLVTTDPRGRARPNAYSLTDLPPDGRHFSIIVRRVASSRGGSTWMHDAIRAGDILRLSPPANLFPIPKLARAHLLLSAGIGITPFLSWLPALARAGVPAHLHHFCRPDEAEIFRALLAGHPATLHPGRADPAPLLSGHKLGTHVAICGPDGFMADMERAAHAAGFPPSKIHREHFGGAAPGAPFVAILANSARRIPVAPDMSLLEALEQAGLDPPSLCRGGVCGQCRLTVLSGAPEHRDHVLSPAERAGGRAIMTCVSRATTPELVLAF